MKICNDCKKPVGPTRIPKEGECKCLRDFFGMNDYDKQRIWKQLTERNK